MRIRMMIVTSNEKKNKKQKTKNKKNKKTFFIIHLNEIRMYANNIVNYH